MLSLLTAAAGAVGGLLSSPSFLPAAERVSHVRKILTERTARLVDTEIELSASRAQATQSLAAAAAARAEHQASAAEAGRGGVGWVWVGKLGGRTGRGGARGRGRTGRRAW